MRRDDRGDSELLAAYVDGVAELSLDERKRVDDLLARDPALRESETATRALLGQLRDLPPQGGEPDWSALGRSIGDAVGNAVPQTWWQRLRWRLIIPALAVATAAAVLALVLQDPTAQQQDQPVIVKDKDENPLPVDPDNDPDNDEEDISSSIPLWLDGTDLEIAIEAAELFDLEWDLDEESVPETAELLPPTDLEWVDELDGAELERAEQYLDHPRPRRGRS